MKTTTRTAATEDPCRGAALELNQVEQRCTVKRGPGMTQPAALKASLFPSPVKIATGAEGLVAVRFNNTDRAPLRVVIPRDCLGWSCPGPTRRMETRRSFARARWRPR